LDEALRKKYIPMTETTYYTLLAVTVPRHGYAIMQYVSELTKGRIVLGTGTLYTMVGRLAADGVIVTVPGNEKKAYKITETGRVLLLLETQRLVKQLEDGIGVLGVDSAVMAAADVKTAVDVITAADGTETADVAAAGDGTAADRTAPAGGRADKAVPAGGEADRGTGADFQNGGGVSTGYGMPMYYGVSKFCGMPCDGRGEDFQHGSRR